MKLGQGNTLWILVVAIIALIAAAVLIIMFTGRTGDTDRSIQNCLGKGGICEIATESGGCPTPNKLPVVGFSCPDTRDDSNQPQKQICCIG